MRLRERVRRMREGGAAVDLTDPEAVIIGLLMSLPREKLRAFIAAAVKASRDPQPSGAVAEEMGQAVLDSLYEGAKRRPELLAHFRRVTLLLIAWGDKNQELKARARL